MFSNVSCLTGGFCASDRLSGGVMTMEGVRVGVGAGEVLIRHSEVERVGMRYADRLTLADLGGGNCAMLCKSKSEPRGKTCGV